MAMYPFQCRVCGRTKTIDAPVGSHISRPECDWPLDTQEDVPGHGVMARVYSFSPGRPTFEGHYNPTLGQYVSTKRELRSVMDQKNAAMTERTGIPYDLRPTDLREIAGRSVDGAMLDRLQREHRDSGNPAPFPKAMIEAVEG